MVEFKSKSRCPIEIQFIGLNLADGKRPGPPSFERVRWKRTPPTSVRAWLFATLGGTNAQLCPILHYKRCHFLRRCCLRGGVGEAGKMCVPRVSTPFRAFRRRQAQTLWPAARSWYVASISALDVDFARSLLAIARALLVAVYEGNTRCVVDAYLRATLSASPTY